MGIGRFACTPIVPLMTTQAVLSQEAAETASPIDRAWRASLAALVASLAAMPLLPNTIGYQASRLDQIPALRRPMYALSS
jgi:hypothetical protein